MYIYIIYIYIYDAIKLFHFQVPNFLLKLAYFKTQKSSLGKTIKIFYNFLRALFW